MRSLTDEQLRKQLHRSVGHLQPGCECTICESIRMGAVMIEELLAYRQSDPERLIQEQEAETK